MIDFLIESETFRSITFSGCYDMPLDHFEKLYDHYKETGENLLDDYSSCIHKSWDQENVVIDTDGFNEIMQSISKIRGLSIFEPEFIHLILNKTRKQYKKFRSYNERDKIRSRANHYTSKGEVRDTIFDMYGEVCLKCGSTNDIQLDHVVSVRRGGKNDIDNLQPLCKSCNVSKGIKIRDYRNGL